MMSERARRIVEVNNRFDYFFIQGMIKIIYNLLI